MKLDDRNQKAVVIKLAAEAYAIEGGSPGLLLKEAAEWLLDTYQKTGDKNCVCAGAQVVKAYVEMGMPYSEIEETFDKILTEMGTSREEQFPQAFYTADYLKVSLTHIREILGRWPKATAKEEGVDWTARDIYNRIQNHVIGCRFYKRVRDNAVYELLVLEDAAYLMDIEKKKVYAFRME